MSNFPESDKELEEIKKNLEFHKAQMEKFEKTFHKLKREKEQSQLLRLVKQITWSISSPFYGYIYTNFDVSPDDNNLRNQLKSCIDGRITIDIEPNVTLRETDGGFSIFFHYDTLTVEEQKRFEEQLQKRIEDQSQRLSEFIVRHKLKYRFYTTDILRRNLRREEESNAPIIQMIEQERRAEEEKNNEDPAN